MGSTKQEGAKEKMRRRLRRDPQSRTEDQGHTCSWRRGEGSRGKHAVSTHPDPCQEQQQTVDPQPLRQSLCGTDRQTAGGMKKGSLRAKPPNAYSKSNKHSGTCSALLDRLSGIQAAARGLLVTSQPRPPPPASPARATLPDPSPASSQPTPYLSRAYWALSLQLSKHVVCTARPFPPRPSKMPSLQQSKSHFHKVQKVLAVPVLEGEIWSLAHLRCLRGSQRSHDYTVDLLV